VIGVSVSRKLSVVPTKQWRYRIPKYRTKVEKVERKRVSWEVTTLTS
jgi:hypothetical protein